jgi:NAD(P)-dependent dehydrogenase (short-subunit alcohol dehydrogenase family)
MSSPLPPRTVLVTGAARRLGRAFSLAFARAGWDVACHYQHSRDEALQTCAEVEALGRKAWAIAGDMADAAAQQAVFSQAVQAIGQWPDAIVNNASLFEPDTGLDFSPELLQQQMQVNLVAPLQLASAAGTRRAPSACHRHAPCRGACAGPEGVQPEPRLFSYTLSKLALERAVALQAQALAPQVRVSAVAPGLIYVSGPQTTRTFTAPAA